MNTKNNKKFQETDALMCDMFLKLLDEYAFEDISISLLCQKTGITRATFYSHFGDMDHFFDAVAKRLFLALAEEDRTLIRKDVYKRQFFPQYRNHASPSSSSAIVFATAALAPATADTTTTTATITTNKISIAKKIKKPVSVILPTSK